MRCAGWNETSCQPRHGCDEDVLYFVHSVIQRASPAVPSRCPYDDAIAPDCSLVLFVGLKLSDPLCQALRREQIPRVLRYLWPCILFLCPLMRLRAPPGEQMQGRLVGPGELRRCVSPPLTLYKTRKADAENTRNPSTHPSHSYSVPGLDKNNDITRPPLASIAPPP